MRRMARPISADLDALLAERDDLQIKISLEADASNASANHLVKLSTRLAEVEALIAAQWAPR